MRESDCMQPRLSLLPRLVGGLLDAMGPDYCKSLPRGEVVHLIQTLKAMGCKLADINRCLPPEWSKILGAIDIGLHPERHFDDLPPAGHTPFNCSELRDWMMPRAVMSQSLVVEVVGSGPFPQKDFVGFIQRHGHDVVSGGAAAHVVIGRRDWTGVQIDGIIDRRVGKSLRIYSQEMFLAFLACQRDPFLAGAAVLSAFRSGHEGLDFVSQGWSGWVQAFVGSIRRGNKATIEFGVEVSPIAIMGYRVGKSGLPRAERRRILEQAFREDLPVVGDESYMSPWDRPGTPGRLWRIASHLASLCIGAASKPALHDAVADWEDDLAWLHATFYHGHMRFGWPSTRV